MISREMSRLLLALVATAALAVILTVAAGALAALPALLAFVPLLAGRYLGADRLERLIEARTRSRPRRAAGVSVRPRAAGFASPFPRGGGLLARSLAKRPPPVAPALT